MERFFVDPDGIIENTAVITGEDVLHISRVLRLRIGDTVCLCDGQKNEYTARITEMEKQTLTLSIIERTICDTESPWKVTLYQAMPKAGKMETIIQKCVELGLYALQPVLSARCVARLEDESGIAKKLVRYRRVAYEASKQSWRGIIPQIYPPIQLDECDFSMYGLILLAYEGEKQQTLKSVLRKTNFSKNKDVAILIGPEGGFEEDEVACLKARGAKSITLGKRILRTETAGMALLAMILYELE